MSVEAIPREARQERREELATERGSSRDPHEASGAEDGDFTAPSACTLHEDGVLGAFRRDFEQEVLPLALRQLGSKGATVRRWLYEPLRYTLLRRRNFFRAALLLAASDGAVDRRVRASLGAAVEIAWTCALVLDDLRDTSLEREGQTAAHVRYGGVRCLAAVIGAMPDLFVRLVLGGPGAPAFRARRGYLSLAVLWRCSRAEMQRRAPTSMAKYRCRARDINASLHWILLAPLDPGTGRHCRRLLSVYADHSAIAGRMLNDIADYWGGASERDGRFEDFRNRQLTLPVLLLLDGDLATEARRIVDGYLRGTGDLTLPFLLRLMSEHGIASRSIALARAELAAAGALVRQMRVAGLPAPLVDALERWNAYLEEKCARTSSGTTCA